MKKVECKCIIEIHKKKNDVFYFLGVNVIMPDGTNKYFCDMLTEKMALEASEKYKVEITE